jgi:hypothetical protein
LLFCKLQEHGEHAVIVEYCQVWRYFADCMRSLLRIAAGFQSGRLPHSTDWDAIGYCPTAVGRTNLHGYDWFNMSPREQEKSWKVMAGVIRTGRNRDRTMWTRLVNALLGLGRVRPWVITDGSGPSGGIKLSLTSANLLSYLALQLCLMASKQDAFAVCSYCHKDYAPRCRAPKAGQRNFCPDCRAGGVPVREAQRARRERLRAQR